MAKLTRIQIENDRAILTMELALALHKISVLEVEKRDLRDALKRSYSSHEMDKDLFAAVVEGLDPSEDRE